jgi:signal transduction histidine kinase
VRAAVADALDTLAGARDEAAAEVEVDVDDVAVVCAPALLQTIMTNLLSNAFKFLPGRIPAAVRVAARVRDGICQIHGGGQRPRHRARAPARIFEPFYRTPGTRAPAAAWGWPRFTGSSRQPGAASRCGPSPRRAPGSP